MESKTFYYARVSSSDQNLARQIVAFKEMGAKDGEIITDKASGKNTSRPGYQYLKTTLLRSGDTLIVKSLDRLSRRKQDIEEELQFFKKQGIRVKIMDLPTTMIDFPPEQQWVSNMVNNIIIEVIGTIAQQEREQTRIRQREGIDAALIEGVHFGRPKAVKPDNWDVVYRSWKNGEITARKAQKEMGLKPTTFYKFVKEEEGRA